MSLSINGIGMTSQRTRERLVQRLRDKGVRNEQVLLAMMRVPRHLLVDEALASRAYDDTPLPIGHGQTISQPYIVARMTEALLAQGPLRSVLEIGTGSGYQTAILAALVPKVYTVERIAALGAGAKQKLRGLGMTNIEFRIDDGGRGWPEAAPFDAIIVTAAATQIPSALIEQLAIGARLIIPVGDDCQQLICATRTQDGIATEHLELVNFVPLIRDRG